MILLLALQVKAKSQISNILYKVPRLHTLSHQNCGYKNPGGQLVILVYHFLADFRLCLSFLTSSGIWDDILSPLRIYEYSFEKKVFPKLIFLPSSCSKLLSVHYKILVFYDINK